MSTRRRTIRRVLAAALAAVLLAAGGCTRTGSSDLQPRLSGIAMPGNDLAFQEPAHLEATLNAVAETGARWLRFDIPWTHVSWQPGQFDWSPYDTVVDQARQRGLRIVGVLGTLAPHLRGNADWRAGPSEDAQYDGFIEYARMAAERYAGKVDAWEVWNEPNLDQSWAPAPDVQAYARLFVATEAVVRPRCKGCLILLGGTGGATGAPDIDTLTWFQGLAATEAPRHADAAAMHPYSDMVTGSGGEMSLVPQVRAILTAAGYPDLPLWGTEVGAPTAGAHSVDEATAVTLMWQADEAWSANEKTGPLFWYTLRDRAAAPAAGDASADRENYFGLLRIDGSRKPAYDELVRLNSRESTSDPTAG